MKLSPLLLGAVLPVALAAPAGHDYSGYTLHERRNALPSPWSEGKRLDPKTSLPMRIGLKQRNLDHGHNLLTELSDPSSHRYGKYLSAGEVHDLFAPPEDSVDNVRAWLESAGIAPHRVSQSANKQWLQFDADADEAEQLFRTEYYVYSHSGSGKSHVSCREYHVPHHVSRHVDYVTPGIKLLEVEGVRPSRLDKRKWDPIPPILRELTLPLDQLLSQLLLLCDVAVTPPCIEAMYNITKGNKSTPGNELGIFEGLGDVYNQHDLNMFFSTLAHEIPQDTHPELKAIDGAKAPTNLLNAGPESDLDFQIAYPIVWPQNMILFQTDDMVYENNYTFSGFLNNFLDAIDGSYCSYSAFGQTGNSPLDPPYPNPAKGGYKGKLQCGVYEPTNVISISYGGAEASLPISYQRRQCSEFMKLGLQGVSVVVASGDSGVEQRGGDPRPSNCLGNDDKVFAPGFPATCPYLTTVGGTYLPPGADPKNHDEVATNSFPSGGGFSNIYKRPDYQNEAVEHYFKNFNPPYKYYESVDNSSFAQNNGVYNRIGRGFPDVAAIADNVVVYNKGLPNLVGGTSAAAPVFAAMLTRINEERIEAGKPTVGFVNPLLYKHPEVFNDITEGSNPGCGTDGFKASKGWDPVTGLGTPDFPKLMDLFMNQE